MKKKPKLFAAIDVGSYELSMKIYEIAGGKEWKQIDYIRHRIDLGTESYSRGILSYERMEELCHILREFKGIMDSYRVDDYKAYGTSAVRELKNTMIVLDQIRTQTGLDIEVLSNSEQRYLDYKSVASAGYGFEEIIEKGTVILDIGGGSIQLSLFDKDTLITTQNIRLGVFRLKDQLNEIGAKPSHTVSLLEEMINDQLSVFKKLHVKDREIHNIIVVDDYVSTTLCKYREKDSNPAGYLSRNTFEKLMEEKFMKEMTGSVIISSQLIKCTMETLGAGYLWAPGVTLCDGIAYDYAVNNKLISAKHDFEQDIAACAKNISNRYQGSRKRGEALEKLAISIFDATKKLHGLGKRERLFLRIAAILQDCGRYVSLTQVGECSYHIVMNTEIIGLSHAERGMVANIVKFNHEEFTYYNELANSTAIDRDEYLIIAKLTAILRLACALDSSHKQKFTNVKVSLEDNNLILRVDTDKNIELEKGLFDSKVKFFEEVYNVQPVLKQKRRI
ncbi:MAG: exopolyphosphatase [Lachnospiraceae bacterium]|nr:exopolyphosphatase [Lachnospiraceae bacterium]